MSNMNYNNNQIPIQQQQPAPPQQFYNCGGVYGGNQQPNYGGNQQPNYGGNQQLNYGGNQQPYYGGNQPTYGGNQPTYGGNQPTYGGNQTTYEDNQPTYGANQQPNYGGNQQSNYGGNQPFFSDNQQPNYRNNNQPNYSGNKQLNYGYRNRSRSPYYNYPGRRVYNNNNNNNYQPQQRQRYNKGPYYNNRGSNNNDGSNRRPLPPGNLPISNQQQRRRGPRQLTMNDFLQPQLHNNTPLNVRSLPSEFNVVTAPVDALPQRQHSRTTTTTNNNTTQPFVVSQQNDQPQQQDQRQRVTTSSFRRRERRNRQQQYHQNQINNNNNSNRFAVLATDENNNDHQNIDNDHDEPLPINMNNKKKNKTKTRAYLEPDRILKWFEDNAKTASSGRGNQTYILDSISFYDQWIRNHYQLQIWQKYLEIGIENRHWAKEVIQRTKKRDDIENIRFVKKQIKQFSFKITEANVAIADLQIELGNYWTQTTAQTTTQILAQTTADLTVQRMGQTEGAATTIAQTTIYANRDRLEKAILKYLHNCTQHVKKMVQTKIQLAKTQMDEFKALEIFQQKASPSQLNIHFMLKPKIKTWSIKNKNYRTALKRVEYDLPPKFIEKIDFTFKLDESILSQSEAQVLYDKMRQITKNYRIEAMNTYLEAITREREILKNEIDLIIEGFPLEENSDDTDVQSTFETFQHYHELREKRLNLEIEQSLYFLEEKRVEGEINDQDERIIIAPTHIRSLGEDFSVQM